jgi:hypothetical protein
MRSFPQLAIDDAKRTRNINGMPWIRLLIQASACSIPRSVCESIRDETVGDGYRASDLRAASFPPSFAAIFSFHLLAKMKEYRFVVVDISSQSAKNTYELPGFRSNPRTAAPPDAVRFGDLTSSLREGQPDPKNWTPISVIPMGPTSQMKLSGAETSPELPVCSTVLVLLEREFQYHGY